MSTFALASSIDYTASGELLARSHRTRSHVTHTRHTTSSGHHGHFPWGLVVGLLVLVAVIAAVVFLVRRNRVSP